jgi:hypothetical protein
VKNFANFFCQTKKSLVWFWFEKVLSLTNRAVIPAFDQKQRESIHKGDERTNLEENAGLFATNQKLSLLLRNLFVSDVVALGLFAYLCLKALSRQPLIFYLEKNHCHSLLLAG